MQALASLIGGTSVRLTVFVLSLLNVAAFAVTGLLLHWLTRGDRRRQLRAALLWTANPLLLQVLVAGAHVDSQAIVFGVGAVAVFSLGTRPGTRPGADAAAPGSTAAGAARPLVTTAAGAGALIGLGFAIKVTMALVGAGLAIGSCWPGEPGGGQHRPPRPGASGRWSSAVARGWVRLAAGASLALGPGRCSPRRCGKAVSCRSARRGGRCGPRCGWPSARVRPRTWSRPAR